MPATNNTAQTVELPPDLGHITTTAKAETWEAWNALTEADGWEERTWPVEGDEIGTYPACVHTQKEAKIRGHRIVVFPPRQPGVEQVARDILAESMTPIVTPQEDEAWDERQ